MSGERRRMIAGRRLAAVTAFAVIAGSGAYGSLTLLAPLPAITSTVRAVDTPVPASPDLALPDYGATAIGAAGFDGILASSGADGPLPIASISKVVTALVVLDAKPLATAEPGPDIRFTAADTALYSKYLAMNGKVERVESGLVMSERDVLEVVLVSSANNYAESLADWAFGSEEGFVGAATDWLSKRGFASTTLVEPTGMSPGNTSTATDLVGIGKLALAHPVIAEIVASKHVDVPFLGGLENSNALVGHDGIDGIKTGTLDAAGACLLFSADYSIGGSSVTVIGVVLGGADHDSLDLAVRALLGTVAASFHEVTLAEKGEPFATYSSDWDTEAAAVATEDASVLVWSDAAVTGEVSARSIEPPGTAHEGDPVGTVTFTVSGRTVEVPLELAGSIEDPGPFWRLARPFGTLPWA